jgi:hypothetical protein
MLELTKTLLRTLQTADRLVAFKDGSRHYLRVYPIRDNWNVTTDIDVPGSRVVGSAFRDVRHSNDPERGSCAASLTYSPADVFQLLKVGDCIALEWWPDCNSPFLEKHGMTRDVLRLLVDRKEGKKTRRIELHLLEEITNHENACIRMCKGFPAPRKHTEDAA